MNLPPWTMTKFISNFPDKAVVLVNIAMIYSKFWLTTFWHCAKIELIPPTSVELPTTIQSIKKKIQSTKTGSFKQLTVKETAEWFGGHWVVDVVLHQKDHKQTWYHSYDVWKPIFNSGSYLSSYLNVLTTCVETAIWINTACQIKERGICC